jgi:hypothetical protein
VWCGGGVVEPSQQQKRKSPSKQNMQKRQNDSDPKQSKLFVLTSGEF